MIKQDTLREYIELEAAALKRYKELTALFKKAMDDKEEVEEGPYALKVTKSKGKNTAWKKIHDKMVELHPELKGSELDKLVENFTSHPDSYTSEVIPAAGGQFAVYIDNTAKKDGDKEEGNDAAQG